MNRVSVVIPTRNRPHLVCNAVRSALRQTYCDLEIIVVIDGPDPSTLEALEQMAHPNLKIVTNPVNLGLAEARNVGVRHAFGDWIAFLDDDDEWLPRKIERQLALARQSGTGPMIVGCRYIEKTPTLERVVPDILPETSAEISEYIYCARGFLQPSTLLTSKQLLQEVPFTSGIALEDTDWLLRATQDAGARVIVHPEPLSIFNNASIEDRLGGAGPWEPVLAWGIANRRRFSKRSFPIFVIMECVARSRRHHEPFSNTIYLLISAWVFGGISLEALRYFLAYLFLSPEQRRRFRGMWTRAESLFRQPHPDPACLGGSLS